MVRDVDRSLVAYLGAANHFSKDHLDIPENRELMEKAHYFYMAVSISDSCCVFVLYSSVLKATYTLVNIDAQYTKICKI